MTDTLIVNVDTWGAGGKQLTKGDVVPADLPDDVDMDWAKENKVVVTAEEFKAENPDWKPKGKDDDTETKPADASQQTSTRESRATGHGGADRPGRSS